MQTVLKNRNNSIDVFRLVCAILVVIIHTEPLLEVNTWLSFFFSNVLARIAVPFFFIVSGIYYSKVLIKSNNGWKHFFNWLKKIVIVYTIWSCFYFAIDFIDKVIFSGGGIISWVKNCIFTYFISGSYYHFWYFPALIISVFIITLFKQLRIHKFAPVIGLIFYVLGCLSCAYFNLLVKISVINSLLNFPYFEVIRRIFMTGFPYVTLGFFITFIQEKVDSISNIKITWGLVITAILFLIEILIVIICALQKNIILTFMQYPLMFFIALYLLKNPLNKLSKIAPTCRKMANFIYYSHPLFIWVLNKTWRSCPNTLKFVIVIMITIVLSYSISKIKLRKNRSVLK